MGEHQDMISELISGFTSAFSQWLESEQLVVGDILKEALVEALETWVSEQPCAFVEIFRDAMQDELAKWLHQNRHALLSNAQEQIRDIE